MFDSTRPATCQRPPWRLLAPLTVALALGSCTAGEGDCYDIAATGSLRVRIVAPYRADGEYIYDPDHLGTRFSPSSDPLCASLGDLDLGDALVFTGIEALVIRSNECTQYASTGLVLPPLSHLIPRSVGYQVGDVEWYDPDHESALVSFRPVDGPGISTSCQGNYRVFLVPMGARHGSTSSVATPGELPPWLLVRQFDSFVCGAEYERIECVETWVVEVSHEEP